jgi:hypothetical protein
LFDEENSLLMFSTPHLYELLNFFIHILISECSRGRTASYLNRPHTDPDVRNYRIRLLSYIFARVKHAP